MTDKRLSRGLAHERAGEPEAAEREYLTLVDAPDEVLRAHAKARTACVQRMQGRLEDAALSARQALATAEAAGEPDALAAARIELALLALERGDHAEAQQELEAADPQTDLTRFGVLDGLGTVMQQRGDFAEAEELFRRALSLAES